MLNEQRSDASQDTSSASSAGWPMRPIGIRDRNSRRSSSGTRSVRPASITPGTTQFTSTPVRATSLATDFVKAMTPALEAEYADISGLDDPWFRGRAIVIGDAAHACPPLIAQGAAMCAEDAVVLAELVASDLPVGQALSAFMRRRMPRVELVVRNSMQLVRWEMGLEAHTEADVARTMNSTLGFLAAAEA